jgi:hypothetical protein
MLFTLSLGRGKCELCGPNHTEDIVWTGQTTEGQTVRDRTKRGQIGKIREGHMTKRLTRDEVILMEGHVVQDA